MPSFAPWLHWDRRKSRDNLGSLNFAWHLKQFIFSIVSGLWFDHRKSRHYWKSDLWDYMSLEIRSISTLGFIFFPIESYYIILEGGRGVLKVYHDKGGKANLFWSQFWKDRSLATPKFLFGHELFRHNSNFSSVIVAKSFDINAPLDYLSVFNVHSFEVHGHNFYFIGGQLLKTFKALFLNLKARANIQIFCNIIDIWRDHWDQSSDFLFWRKQ